MDDMDLINDFSSYLKIIAHKIIQMQDKILIPHDITSQQARLLIYINKQQEADNNICQKELEAYMQLKGPSITSLLKGLEKKEYIIRNTEKEDGRKKKLFITPKGYRLIQEMKCLFKHTEEKIISGLTEEEKIFLRKILKRIYHSISIS